MDSKLKKKINIILFLLVFFVIIVLNLHRIRFALGMYNIYNQEKNANAVSEDTDPIGKVEIYNPLTSIIEKDIEVEKDNELVTEENSEIVEPVVDKGTDTDNWPTPTPTPKPVEQSVTTKSYVGIVEEYNEKLEALRASFESKLDNLIQQGIAEYQSGDISTAKLSSKYLSAGTNLEKTSDSQFNSLVKEMEKELKSNNHDVKVIKEIREYYNSFKNEMKQEIIGRGLKHLR